MARLASYHVVLRMKRKETEFDKNTQTLVETVEHIVVTNSRHILKRATVVIRTPETTQRKYHKWKRGSRLRPKTTVADLHSFYTNQGYTTVYRETHESIS